MDKKENKGNESEEKKFDKIPESRKKTIINYCMMAIVQYQNRTPSQLRVNQENIKQRLGIDHVNQKGKLKGMDQELDFVDVVCYELIENIKAYKALQPSERKVALYKKLEELGVVDQEAEKQSILDQIIEEAKGYEVDEKVLKKKTKDRLYRPDLLFRNSVTGERGIHYIRYSKKGMPQSFDFNGKKVKLERIGEMTYMDAVATERDLTEYLVTTEADSAEIFMYDISFEKIEKVPEYRRVFFDELLSHENLTTLNVNGYVGEIVDSRFTLGSYEVYRDPERFTAVAELKAKLREIEQQKKSDKNDPDADEFDK